MSLLKCERKSIKNDLVAAIVLSFPSIIIIICSIQLLLDKTPDIEGLKKMLLGSIVWLPVCTGSWCRYFHRLQQIFFLELKEKEGGTAKH